MHKKKIQTLIAAGLLSVGVIGGTLAWFTSEDSVTNIFNTGSVTDTEDGEKAGIDLNENFVHPGENGKPDVTYDKVEKSWLDKDENKVTYDSTNRIWKKDNTTIDIDDVPGINKGQEASNKTVEITKSVTPGTTLTKEVEIENTADYSQIVRAKVNKSFYIEIGEGDTKTKQQVTHWKRNETTGEIEYAIKNSTENGWASLNLEHIILTLNTNGTWVNSSGNTVEPNPTGSPTGWYYYTAVLQPKATTSDILKNVTLSAEAGDMYKNLKFDVKVEAESVQATNNAIDSVWTDAPANIKALDLKE